jgi:hypothetical protein
MIDIHFQKLNKKFLHVIFKWLEEDHIKEFWDNNPAYKIDINLYVEGRIKKSPYYNGIFDYWVAFNNDQPYSLIMSSSFKAWTGRDLFNLKTICLDFCVGNLQYLGKNLAAKTLEKFIDFYKMAIDTEVKLFFIDPNINNIKAIKTYNQVGFKTKSTYKIKEGYFKGNTNLIMIKKI